MAKKINIKELVNKKNVENLDSTYCQLKTDPIKRRTYQDKLKDPRWQRLRLKIFERDEFTCQNCGEKFEELQIHHLAYRKDTNVWDYKDEELITLCFKCHENMTKDTNECIKLIRLKSFADEYLSHYLSILRLINNLDPDKLRDLVYHIEAKSYCDRQK